MSFHCQILIADGIEFINLKRGKNNMNRQVSVSSKASISFLLMRNRSIRLGWPHHGAKQVHQIDFTNQINKTFILNRYKKNIWIHLLLQIKSTFFFTQIIHRKSFFWSINGWRINKINSFVHSVDFLKLIFIFKVRPLNTESECDKPV